MATAAAAAVAQAQRRIQHEFFHQDAVRPERAIAFEPERMTQRRVWERWERAGIIREVPGGRYWFDVVAYDEWQTQRFTRLRIVLLVLLVGLGIATAALILTEPPREKATLTRG